MLYHIAIHHPKAEHRGAVVESMHRFAAVARSQAGLREVHTLADTRSDALMGMAVWESAEALGAARPALSAATEGDDFDTWEAEPIQVYLLEEI